jgi:hypothetical protein
MLNIAVKGYEERARIHELAKSNGTAAEKSSWNEQERVYSGLFFGAARERVIVIRSIFRSTRRNVSSAFQSLVEVFAA